MPDIIRCLACASEFDLEKLSNVSACPACGSKGIPIRPADVIQVRVTWHELHVLVVWAERWASRHQDPEMIKAVRTIAAFLGAQHPDKPALTFMGEIEELREKFGSSNVQQNVVPEKDGMIDG